MLGYTKCNEKKQLINECILLQNDLQMAAGCSVSGNASVQDCFHFSFWEKVEIGLDLGCLGDLVWLSISSNILATVVFMWFQFPIANRQDQTSMTFKLPTISPAPPSNTDTFLLAITCLLGLLHENVSLVVSHPFTRTHTRTSLSQMSSFTADLINAQIKKCFSSWMVTKGLIPKLSDSVFQTCPEQTLPLPKGSWDRLWTSLKNRLLQQTSIFSTYKWPIWSCWN